jgi:hypothetical protein
MISCTRAFRSTLLALLLALTLIPTASAEPVDATSDDDAAHPPDPFVGSYALPRERELGTTAGQFRAIGSAMLVFGGSGIEPGVHGTLELMTFPYLSVRGSLQMTVAAPDSNPCLYSWRRPDRACTSCRIGSWT